MSTIIPDSLSITQLQAVALDFEDAQARLMGAHHEFAITADKLTVCRFQLDEARACGLSQGVEGKNEPQREAGLRLSLGELYAEIHRLELRLSNAKLELTFAQLEWDTLRYRLRSYESIATLKGGRG